jgi:hypothetical protein
VTDSTALPSISEVTHFHALQIYNFKLDKLAGFFAKKFKPPSTRRKSMDQYKMGGDTKSKESPKE